MQVLLLDFDQFAQVVDTAAKRLDVIVNMGSSGRRVWQLKMTGMHTFAASKCPAWPDTHPMQSLHDNL